MVRPSAFAVLRSNGQFDPRVGRADCRIGQTSERPCGADRGALRGRRGVLGAAGARPGLSGPSARSRWARMARARPRSSQCGDDAQPAARESADQDMEREHMAHQRTRSSRAWGCWRGPGARARRQGVGSWAAAVADDLRAPARGARPPSCCGGLRRHPRPACVTRAALRLLGAVGRSACAPRLRHRRPPVRGRPAGCQ